MKWIFVVLATIGYLLNIKGSVKLSYIVWFVSNSCWAIYFLAISQYESMSMFIIYDILCIYSLMKQWKKKK